MEIIHKKSQQLQELLKKYRGWETEEWLLPTNPFLEIYTIFLIFAVKSEFNYDKFWLTSKN